MPPNDNPGLKTPRKRKKSPERIINYRPKKHRNFDNSTTRKSKLTFFHSLMKGYNITPKRKETKNFLNSLTTGKQQELLDKLQKVNRQNCKSYQEFIDYLGGITRSNVAILVPRNGLRFTTIRVRQIVEMKDIISQASLNPFSHNYRKHFEPTVIIINPSLPKQAQITIEKILQRKTKKTLQFHDENSYKIRCVDNPFLNVLVDEVKTIYPSKLNRIPSIRMELTKNATPRTKKFLERCPQEPDEIKEISSPVDGSRPSTPRNQIQVMHYISPNTVSNAHQLGRIGFEWLHIAAYSFKALTPKEAQNPKNLFVGSKAANSCMIVIENFVKLLALNNHNPKIDIRVSMHLNTWLGKEVCYKVTWCINKKSYQYIWQFDPLTPIEPISGSFEVWKYLLNYHPEIFEIRNRSSESNKELAGRCAPIDIT